MKAPQVVPADQVPLLANMSVSPSCLQVSVSAAGHRMGSLGWPREAAWDKDTARRGPRPLHGAWRIHSCRRRRGERRIMR